MRYFKEPELTRESLTDDGWFKSGDIGQWEANGTLTIIDRVKNLVSCTCFPIENAAEDFGSAKCKMESTWL